MTTLILAIVAVLAVAGCILAALAYAQINSDGHYTPSEADQQAQRDVTAIVREINKPNYTRSEL